jgi:hypothetical protein
MSLETLQLAIVMVRRVLHQIIRMQVIKVLEIALEVMSLMSPSSGFNAAVARVPAVLRHPREHRGVQVQRAE